MHRYILRVTSPSTEVDHEDNNGLNNQRYNLRKGTKEDNQHNQRLRPDNTSGLKGVHWCKTYRVWIAQIQSKGKRIRLGEYKDKIKAAKAYDKAAVSLFGKFAKTNISLGLIKT